MKNLILVIILLVILAAAAGYIYKAKKRGATCIGCPQAGKCGSCGGCGSRETGVCSCHTKED